MQLDINIMIIFIRVLLRILIRFDFSASVLKVSLHCTPVVLLLRRAQKFVSVGVMK